MLILSSTTDKLSLVTDFSGTIHVDVVYTDRDTSTGVVGLAGRQNTTITTSTTTDILAAPGATTSRNIRRIFIRNAHATSVQVVGVQYDANSTLYGLHKCVLWPGDSISFSEKLGWLYVPKLLKYPKIDAYAAFINTADLENNDTTWTIGATFTTVITPPLPVSKLITPSLIIGHTYNFEGIIFLQTDSATSGAQITVRATASQSQLVTHVLQVTTPSATAAVLAQGASVKPLQGAALSGACYAYITGSFIPDNTDVLIVAINPEVATAEARVYPGSYIRVWEPGG